MAPSPSLAARTGHMPKTRRGGLVEFLDSSTAGNGIFAVNGAENLILRGPSTFSAPRPQAVAPSPSLAARPITQGGGQMNFQDSSTAGNGTFTITSLRTHSRYTHCLLRRSTRRQWHLHHQRQRRHQRGTVIGNGISFINTFGAGNATVIANGGVNGGSGGAIGIPAISATGSTARVEVFGNGLCDFISGNLNILRMDL